MSKLFTKATQVPSRLKMYIYGDTGTGKTVTSVQFPKPAVVDTQRGTEHYHDDFNFDILDVEDPANPTIIEHAVEDLMENPGPYKTFVIDSMTDVYERMKQKRLKWKREKKGDYHVELEPNDYGWLKGEVKRFIQKLLQVDMNVIATAESTTEYSNTEFMKPIGTKPEGHKKMPYIFDVVIELTKSDDDEDVRWAKVHKDRTNQLPKHFEFSYDSFKEYMDAEGLERDAESQDSKSVTSAQREYETEWNGKTVKTAGITGETLEQLSDISDKVGEEKVRDILHNEYFVDSILDLGDDEGKKIIEELTNSN